MKHVLYMIILLFVSGVCRAQTWAEWMQQKKTQEKYLLQQIAVLQEYIDQAKKGYDIVSKGLNTVRSIKEGDVSLHSLFLGSFKTTNPNIKQYARVAAMMAMEVRIVAIARQGIKFASEPQLRLTTGEIDYCKKVFDNLLSGTLENIASLIVLFTDSHWEMKDNERIRQIDQLYADMQEKLGFCSNFSSGLTLLANQRQREQTEIEYSKRINGLK